MAGVFCLIFTWMLCRLLLTTCSVSGSIFVNCFSMYAVAAAFRSGLFGRILFIETLLVLQYTAKIRVLFRHPPAIAATNERQIRG